MEDEEAKRETVRQFLAAQSPSELRRLVNYFREQMGLPPLEEQSQPVVRMIAKVATK